MNPVFANGELVSSRFQVRGLIGGGDLGQVFEVWDLASASVAALKLFVTPAARDAALFGRVEAMARRAAGSPVFAKVLHTGTAAVGPYLVSERQGPSIEQRRLSPAQLGDAFASLAAALDEIHAAGAAHGDLHPRNVFPAVTGGLRATDAGVWALRAAAPNPWPGLPGWTAPEVVQGAAPSAASDIYAFALVVFYALTGAPLFHSLSTGQIDVRALWAEMNGSLDLMARAHELRTSLQPAIAGALTRALAVDPAARPRSVREVAAALVGSQSGGYVPGTVVMRATDAYAVSSGQVGRASEPSPPATRAGGGPGGTVAIPASVVQPSVRQSAPPIQAPPPVDRRSSPLPRPPTGVAGAAGRPSETIVADVSAFPDLHALSAPPPIRSVSQPSGVLPPPVVKQGGPVQPAPPPLVDPSQVRRDETGEVARQDWTTIGFAEAAKAEWAKNQLGFEPSTDPALALPPPEKPKLKRSTLLLIGGMLFVLLILAGVLLFLLLRMDDSGDFPAPKTGLLHEGASVSVRRGRPVS